MSEIDQLRADIAALEAAEKIAIGMPGRSHVAGAIGSIVYDKRAELAKLEAEAAVRADPWDVEKILVKGYLADLHAGTYGQMVAKYAQHLEQRVAELEAELAKRPVAWCARRKDSGGYYQYLDGPRLFPSLEDAKRLFGDSDPKWVIEPYTGEQT